MRFDEKVFLVLMSVSTLMRSFVRASITEKKKKKTWGVFGIAAKAERSKFGRFFYRFPSGEAGLDVYSRVSSFIPTLVRDCTRYSVEGQDLDNMNVIIVTHGASFWLLD